MVRRKSIFRNSSYYYLCNKCLDRRLLFRENEDYLYFIYLLYYFNRPAAVELRHLNLDFSNRKTSHFRLKDSAPLPYVKIIGFCLLPDSFSLIVKQLASNGISNFMQKLGTGYSLHYNKKYERSGPIFCGSFKSIYLDKSVIDKALIFIHLLPSRLFTHSSLKNRYLKIKKYVWSSLPYYLGQRNWSPLLKYNKKSSPSSYAKILKEMIFKSKLNWKRSCLNKNLNHNIQEFILNINNLFNILMLEIFINGLYFLNQIQDIDLI